MHLTALQLYVNITAVQVQVYVQRMCATIERVERVQTGGITRKDLIGVDYQS